MAQEAYWHSYRGAKVSETLQGILIVAIVFGATILWWELVKWLWRRMR